MNSGFDVSTGWLAGALASALLVLGVGSLAILRSGFERRPGWQRLRLALFALACLAGFLLATRPRLLAVSPAVVGVLVTPGAPESELREGLHARLFTLADVRVLPAAFEDLEDGLAERLAARRLGPWNDLATSGPGAWRVLGSGLRAFELDQWPVGVRLLADSPEKPPASPAGVVALRWPRTLMLGEELLVEGRFDAADSANAGALRLVGPGGKEGEVSLDPDETAFAWSAVPKAIGSLTYGLERVGRPGDSQVPETVAWLDVEVRAPELPRVVIRAARPTPEAAALRRNLARRGFETRLETGLGGGTHSRVEGAGTPWVRSPSKALGGELLVVLGPWSASDRATLEREATRRGAGIVASGLEAARSFAGAEGISPGSSPDRSGADGERATAIHVPGPIGVALSPLRIGSARLARPAGDQSVAGRSLLLDDGGSPLAMKIERALDLPPLVLSVVDTVYRYDLRGERAMSSKLWSVLFEAALPPRPWGCTIDDGPIIAGDPLTVSCWDREGTDAPALFVETPRGSMLSVALEARSTQPNARGVAVSGVLWPWPGAHRLRARHASGEEIELPFTARPRADWEAWDLDRRRSETTSFLERRGSAEAPDAAATGRRARRPLPAAAVWGVLISALAVLWGVERSG